MRPLFFFSSITERESVYRKSAASPIFIGCHNLVVEKALCARNIDLRRGGARRTNVRVRAYRVRNPADTPEVRCYHADNEPYGAQREYPILTMFQKIYHRSNGNKPGPGPPRDTPLPHAGDRDRKEKRGTCFRDPRAH